MWWVVCHIRGKGKCVCTYVDSNSKSVQLLFLWWCVKICQPLLCPSLFWNVYTVLIYFFRQITTFIKVRFNLQTLRSKDFSKIYRLKGMKPKNKGHMNFYECCVLTKKVCISKLERNYFLFWIMYPTTWLGALSKRDQAPMLIVFFGAECVMRK